MHLIGQHERQNSLYWEVTRQLVNDEAINFNAITELLQQGARIDLPCPLFSLIPLQTAIRTIADPDDINAQRATAISKFLIEHSSLEDINNVMLIVLQYGTEELAEIVYQKAQAKQLPLDLNAHLPGSQYDNPMFFELTENRMANIELTSWAIGHNATLSQCNGSGMDFKTYIQAWIDIHHHYQDNKAIEQLTEILGIVNAHIEHNEID